MSVVAQDVFTRAIALNTANQAFANLSTSEVLARLNLAQRNLNARLAQEEHLFYLTSVVPPSTSGGSGRSIDLTQAAFVLPVERVVIVYLPDGVTEVVHVDIQDVNAELAPRYYPKGTQLVEVGNDWSAAAGPVNLTVWYISKQAALSLTGTLAQTLQIPDEFAPYFDYDLAIYFSQKDLGRVVADPQEIQRLTALQESVYASLVQYLEHLHGPIRRRWVLPVPAKGDKA